MIIIYMIGSAILIGAGYALGCMRTADKAKASYRASRPAEIHSAVKDLDVALSGVRGRGF